jgi:hypothetical protein
MLLALIAALLGCAIVALLFADNVGLGPRNGMWPQRIRMRVVSLRARALAGAAGLRGLTRHRVRAPRATHPYRG